MLAQYSGRFLVDLLSSIWALLILLMAASEWRQMRMPSYRRIALAAGASLATRGVHMVVGWVGLASEWVSLEWALEGLAVTLFAWAFLQHLFASHRGALGFLGIGLAGIVVGLVLSLHWEARSVSAWQSTVPGLTVLSMLSAWALWRWFGEHRQSAPWFGAAFSVSTLAAVVGLMGLWQVTPWAHLVVLALLMVETYRTILADWGAYGLGLQSASERTQRQSEEMALLMEVNQAVSASLELPVVLEHACESLARSVAADWAYILLPMEDEPEDFTVAARYGWWGRRQKQDTQVHRQMIVRLMDYSLLRHAVLRRRMVLANEARDYEQFDRMHDLLGRPQGGPTLIVPVFHREQSIGVALLGYVEKQRKFTQSDGRLCQALISQVAAAIINARRFQTIEDQVERLEGALWEERQERDLRQAILDSLGGGVVVLDRSGDLFLANVAAERLLGLSRRDMDRRVCQRLQSQFVRDGQESPASQVVLRWGDRALAANLVEIEGKEPRSGFRALLLCDVTALYESRQALERYVAAVSRELNVALLLLNDGGQDPEADLRRRRRLQDLILDLGAISAPKREMMAEVQAVSVPRWVHDVVNEVGARAAAKSVTLVTKLAADLPPVAGDPYLSGRILAHLLEYAVRATPSGGRIDLWATEARLENAAHTLQDFVVIGVRDSGGGLQDSELERVLEPFFQMGPVPQEQGGEPQVNVAIARVLVEAQGGQMWVDSEANKGTSFRFSVPVYGV